MRRYVGQKIIGFLLTVVVVSILTFTVIQILPGDPALLMLGTEGSPEAYTKLQKELNLEQPAWQRYLVWFLNFFQGQWGNSWRYSLPVKELLVQALPLSLFLAVAAMLLALVIAIPVGVFMGNHPNRLSTGTLSTLSQVGMALPQFWLGLLLIQIFAVKLNLFPAGGNVGTLSLFLPIVTLALPRSAILSRLVRVGVSEVLKQDYVRTAKAKGLPYRVVLYKHTLRNGILEVFTIAGLQFAQLLTGTIVVEQVFGLPGLGQLLLAGVLQRDLPLVQTLVMIIVLLILSFDLLFDLCLGLLDPRLRYE